MLRTLVKIIGLHIGSILQANRIGLLWIGSLYYMINIIGSERLGV